MQMLNKEAIRHIIYTSESGSLEDIKLIAEMDPDLDNLRLKYLPVVPVATNCNLVLSATSITEELIFS